MDIQRLEEETEKDKDNWKTTLEWKRIDLVRN